VSGCLAKVDGADTGNDCVWPGDVGGGLVQTPVFDACDTPPCTCVLGDTCVVGPLRETDGGTVDAYGTCALKTVRAAE
jgi:hypothetical protein